MSRNRKPWQRGYIPQPKPQVREPQLPEGWERVGAGVSGARRAYVWGSYVWGSYNPYKPAAQIVGDLGDLGGKWQIWVQRNRMDPGLPMDGVFRAPDMTARSAEALATWWQIELACMPEDYESYLHTVTGRIVGKALRFGAAYGMGQSMLVDSLKAYDNLSRTDRAKLASVDVDFRQMEERYLAQHTGDALSYGISAIIVVHDEVTVHVDKSSHPATD